MMIYDDDDDDDDETDDDDSTWSYNRDHKWRRFGKTHVFNSRSSLNLCWKAWK